VDAHAAAYLAVRYELTFSLVTKYEILRGLKQKRAAVQLVQFEDLCRASEIIAVGDAHVERAAQLWADAHDRGLPRRSADLLIAATALHNGYLLGTANTKHFDWIPGLKLVNWRLP
jgi:tRNA(fMet)-specific endonuclease VapC